MKMKHLMIDLETLGQTPGCKFFSIGAVPFDLESGEVGEGLYVLIDPARCLTLFEEDSTVEWWQRQAPDAKAELDRARHCNVTLHDGLNQLTDFIHTNDELVVAKDVRIWGNGSDFDNAILSAGYHVIDQQVPWKFWNNRCFRTLKSMGPKTLEPSREGTHHNALDDALHQARWAVNLAGHLKLTQWPGL